MFDLSSGSSERVLVMGHVAPDGDSVASGLALAKQYRGKFFSEGLRPNVSWLVEEIKGVEVLNLTQAVSWKPTTLAIVDCAPTRERTGFPIEQYLAENPEVNVLNIDHHADRLGERPGQFDARISKIIRPISSTAEILVDEGFKDKILYAGLATDTVFFRFSKANQAMASALKLGLTEDEIARYRDHLEVQLDYSQLMDLVSTSVKYIEVARKNLLIVRMPTTDADINITLLNLTRGFDFVAIIQANGRASLRTRLDVDISVFASTFGGGGHPRACGCKVSDVGLFIRKFEDFIAKKFGGE